jgi:hypothetical protein
LSKVYKYCLIAVQHPELDDVTTHEVVFENQNTFGIEDLLNVNIDGIQVPFKITGIRKVNHIHTPNDVYDYRLFAVNG